MYPFYTKKAQNCTRGEIRTTSQDIKVPWPVLQSIMWFHFARRSAWLLKVRCRYSALVSCHTSQGLSLVSRRPPHCWERTSVSHIEEAIDLLLPHLHNNIRFKPKVLYNLERWRVQYFTSSRLHKERCLPVLLQWMNDHLFMYLLLGLLKAFVFRE